MATTGATLPIVSVPSVPGLPAPKVRVTGGSAAWKTYDLPETNWSGGTIQVECQPVTVSVFDLPAGVKVQLELLRYSRRNAGIAASNGASGKQRGWVHPSHAPNPVNGHWTRGGMHATVDPAVASLRQTEWSVVNTDVIDVTQSLFGFMATRKIEYRSTSAVAPDYDPDQTVQGVSTVAAGKMRRPGRRFPYAPAFHAGLYRFRYSVIDPNDERGARVAGPESEIVAVNTEVFPFVTDPGLSAAAGVPLANIDPRYDPKRFRAWVGPTVRLP